MKFLSLLPLALFSLSNAADFCTSSQYSSTEGNPCGNSRPCVSSSFCNREGICQRGVAPGESCNNGEGCQFFSDCKGPEGSRICLNQVGPGESCSTDDSVSVPNCAGGSCVNGICKGGLYKDDCVNTSDCVSEICEDREETGQTTCGAKNNQVTCSSSEECLPSSYCNEEFKCADRKTGGTCRSGFGEESRDCQYRYSCTPLNDEDEPVCVKWESKEVGDYCENPSVCKSHRCENNSCAERNTYCTTQTGSCPTDETCFCGGNGLANGIGTCRSSGCTAALESLSDCANEQGCSPSFLISASNPKSCIRKSCDGQVNGIIECGSASTATINVVFSVALVLSAFSWNNLY